MSANCFKAACACSSPDCAAFVHQYLAWALCACVVLQGGGFKPVGGFFVVLRHALTQIIKLAQAELCVGIARLCGFRPPLRRLFRLLLLNQ